MKNLFIISTILVLGLAFCVNSQSQLQGEMKVISPIDLLDQFSSNVNSSIQFSIANFGSVPYGKTITGKLSLANPINGCQSQDSQIDQSSNKQQQILIAHRGDCSFVKKANFAQLSGAKMLIIADNQDEDIDRLIMVEDGYGDMIQIPVVIINKMNGDILISQLQQESNNEVQLKIKFFINEKQEQVSVQFWMNIEQRTSYMLVKNFKEVVEQLGKKILFEPHYQVYQESQYIYDEQEQSDNCFSGGKYCAPDPDGYEGEGKGTHVLQEIIRQKCIHQNFPKKWWCFMEKFDANCEKATMFAKCAQTQQKACDIETTQIDKCMQDSLIKKPGESVDKDLILNFQKYDNKILQKERKLQTNIYYWPTISIDNQTYRGNLDKDDILEDICANMLKPPKICNSYLNTQVIVNEQNHLNYSVITFAVVVIMLLFTVFMVFVYKRMTKRELSREMSSQVNQMVSQYIAFYESRDKSKDTF